MQISMLKTKSIKPDVSIIVPCFNAGHYIHDCINSALQQESVTVSLEVIVIDDHSDDPYTLDALNTISQMKNVRVLQNTGQRGPAAARNLGISEARGEWLAFLDADDILTENSIGSRLKALDLYPEAAWIGGDLARCDANGSITESSFFRARPRSLEYVGNSFESGHPVKFNDTLDVFLDVALVNTISSIIKTACVRSVHGFDETFLLQQDLHLYLRLAQRFSFVFVPTVVAVIRTHESNSTRSYTRTLRWRHAALSMLSRNQDFRDNRKLREKLKNVALDLSYQNQREHNYFQAAKWRLNAALGLRSSIPSD